MPVEKLSRADYMFLVLVSAMEESPLYELPLDAARLGQEPSKHRQRLEATAFEMVDARLVEIVENLGAQQWKVLPMHEAKNRLRDPATWSARGENVVVEVHATDRGRSIFFGNRFGLSRERCLYLWFNEKPDKRLAGSAPTFRLLD